MIPSMHGVFYMTFICSNILLVRHLGQDFSAVDFVTAS